MDENNTVNGEGANEIYGTSTSPKKKMPEGAITGIVIGCVLLLAGIIVVVNLALQPKSIEISEAEKIYKTVGESYTINYVIEPQNAISKVVTFTSSDSSVATVDENGKITAQKDGEAEIKVSTSNGVTDKIKVVVSELYCDWEWKATIYEDNYYTTSKYYSKLEFEKDEYTLTIMDDVFEGTWTYDETKNEKKMYTLWYGSIPMTVLVEDGQMLLSFGDGIVLYFVQK